LLEPGFDADVRVAFTEFAILPRHAGSGPALRSAWLPLI
jgi:hypothetical protein